MVLVMGYESKDYGPKVDAGRPASPPRVGEVRPARTRSAAAVMTQPHVARDSAAYEQMIKRAYEAPKSGGGAPTPFMHRILDRMAHPGLAFQVGKVELSGFHPVPHIIIRVLATSLATSLESLPPADLQAQWASLQVHD